MIYPIVGYGLPVLKQKARPIAKDEIDIEQLKEDMFETMYHAQGVGLAAPQIGLDIRVFVVDATSMQEDEEDPSPAFKRIFINPEKVEEEGEEWPFEEGCLSIPGIREQITRQAKIKLKYLDEDWQMQEEEFEGIVARIIQHEYDHLEGVLFTDKLSPFKKRLLKGKLNNILKGKVTVDYKMKFANKK